MIILLVILYNSLFFAICFEQNCKVFTCKTIWIDILFISVILAIAASGFYVRYICVLFRDLIVMKLLGTEKDVSLGPENILFMAVKF